MTRRTEAWRLIAGVVGLLVVTAILLSTPSMIVAKSIAIVDTELRHEGERPQKVLVKMDLGNLEELDELPTQLGKWRMSEEHEWDEVADLLNTDVLLSRDYVRPGLYQSVNLLIVQSTNVSSFHPAPVCYRVQGWTVADEGEVVSVPVPNATWAQPAWLSDESPNHFDGNLSAKVLTVEKLDDAKGVVDKRVALYVYLKKDNWAVTHEVTWLRVEVPVTEDTTSEAAVHAVRDLMASAVPYLFDFQEGEERFIGEELLHNHGAMGAAAIVALVGIPTGLIVAGVVRRRE